MSLAVSTNSTGQLALDGPSDSLAGWDRLSSVSFAALPTVRCDCLTSFLATFAKTHRFEPAAVYERNDLIAVLPLLLRRRRGITFASLPVNPWMKCGDLMVNASRSNERDFDELADKALATRARLLDFSWVRESSAWSQLLQAFERRGCYIDRRRMFDVGTIETVGDWDAYLSSRSSGHRKSMRSSLRKLEQLGKVTFERHRSVGDDHILEQLMTEAIQVENLGWKGSENSSVRSNPSIELFFRNVGKSLNESGMLELQFLRIDGRPIAFEWGYVARGVYYSHKVGFDPEFARYSPGQLLMFKQLPEFFGDDEIHQVDTMGILSQATARWTTGQYSMNRYRVSGSGLIPRVAWRTLCQGHKFLKKFRG